MFKKSIFNIEDERLGSVVIYNTYSSKIIELELDEYFFWTTDIKRLDPGTFQWLRDNHFIVPTSLDESKQVIEQYECVTGSNEVGNLFRILPTTKCNARCYYCFEKELPGIDMSLDVADKVVDFIKKRTEHDKSIKLEWFGGEPLLKKDIITYISSRLIDELPDKTIYSTMTTNASLFDLHTINESKNWNLKAIQVTLDGLDDVYDSIKNYKSKRYNFNNTIENVHKLIENGIEVTIRLNYNEDNLLHNLELIDFIQHEFGDTVDVYCSQSYSVGNVPESSVPRFVESIIVKKLLDAGYFKYETLLKRKYAVCGLASFDSFVVIGPDGNVYKCVESMSFPEKSCVGTIFDKELNNELINYWKKPIDEERCLQCPYLPMCSGGCVSARMGLCSLRCFRYMNIVNLLINWVSCNHQHG